MKPTATNHDLTNPIQHLRIRNNVYCPGVGDEETARLVKRWTDGYGRHLLPGGVGVRGNELVGGENGTGTRTTYEARHHLDT